MSTMAASASSSSLPRRIQEIPPRTEYRFELEPAERIAIRLVPESGGTADVFGHELSAATERWYPFGDEAKIAVSSSTGCQIEVVGHVSTEYVADEASPSFTSWSNLHIYLEKKRLMAREDLKKDLASGEASKIRKLASSDKVLHTVAPRWTAPNAQADDKEEGGDTSAYTPEGQGPRIMVLGSEASGKSSLIKFLANYALRSPAVCDPLRGTASEKRESEDQRQDDGSAPGGDNGSQITGWWPTIVSLDPSIGTAPLPCTMSILPLSAIPNSTLPSPSPAYPYGLTPSTSGAIPPSASTVQATSPYSLWLGQETARENERHSRRVVDWLADALDRRLARDERARCSGILVDMPGVTTADSRSRYAFVQHCVQALHVDTIVILGHEKLNIELSRIFGQQGSGISVVKIPKSGGVVELDQTFKQRLRALQVRNYFYGGSNAPRTLGDATKEATEDEASTATSSAAMNIMLEPLGNLPSLSPYSTTIPFDLLEIYKIGAESAAPSSALPIGASRALQDQTQLIKLNPSDSTLDQANISNAVLALVQPVRGGGGPGQADSKVEPPPTDDEIIGSPILGFIHVASIDAAKKKMTILSPSPGKLPSKTAILGSLDWQDA